MITIFFFQRGIAAEKDSLKYVDASSFQLIGKGFTDTENRYERLPASLKDKAAGLAVV